MRDTSIVGYIWLGLHWRYLLHAVGGNLIHGEQHILANIDIVLNYLEEFDLQVTLRAAIELMQFRGSKKMGSGMSIDLFVEPD